MYVYSLIKTLQGNNVSLTVLIPNPHSTKNEEYYFENIRVLQYAEPSVVDRALIMGKRPPEGLKNFLSVLEEEKPDIVHFHELAGSNGITLSHVVEAKKLFYKTIMTFHLVRYSCKTSTLMYRNKQLCDGVINQKKCTMCCYSDRAISGFKATVLYSVATFSKRLNYDTTSWDNSIGTAIGFPNIIKKLKSDLLELAENCDHLVTLTDWYKEILTLNGVPRQKIQHIPQGLPTTHIPSEKKSEINNAQDLKVIFIGRISHIKGVHILIEAVKEITEKNISLDIYGRDNDDGYAKYCKSISSGNLNIRWRGELQPAKVIDILSGFDILCLPSTIAEMSPLVILEAFAASVPVIASNVYGNAQQIENNVNGWLFNFNDKDDLKKKLLQLADNRLIIEEAKKHLPEINSFNSVAASHLELYKSVISFSN